MAISEQAVTAFAEITWKPRSPSVTSREKTVVGESGKVGERGVFVNIPESGSKVDQYSIIAKQASKFRHNSFQLSYGFF